MTWRLLSHVDRRTVLRPVSVAKACERPGLKPTYTVAADLRNELQRDSR